MTTRRSFLAGALGLGSATALAGLLPGFAALARGTDDYKALVCVFLRGGMDSDDSVIPITAPAYDDWSRIRAPLLARYEKEGDDSRTLGGLMRHALGGDGARYGMPRQMSGLAELYNSGQLAIAANVGPLEEPTVRASVVDKTAVLPPRLMSHNDQQSVWETLHPESIGFGWGGRLADAVTESPGFFDAVAVAAGTAFLAGEKVTPFKAPGGGFVRPVRGTSGSIFGVRAGEILENHYTASAASLNNVLASDFADAQGRAVKATNELRVLMKDIKQGESARVPDNGLSNALVTVAKMISLRSALGVKRQVFIVDHGGYDTHSDQATRLPALQGQLSEALAAFYATTMELGVADMVTTFTSSDFGRTLQPNASGTDHGWGGHHFVMGGAVAGGRIHGEMPPIALGHDHDFGRGRLIPTMALSQYGSALGRWFGVSDTDLDEIFPTRGRFDAPPALFG